MTAPTTYPTAGGATVTPGFRINAFNQPVHFFECGGCDGIRGFKTSDVAVDEAQKHAACCTEKPADGGA